MEPLSHNPSSPSTPPHKEISLQKKLLYLVPNSITFLSLCFGLAAIRMSIEGRINNDLDLFLRASYYIIYSGFADFFDGAIARLTKTTSTFGGQFDSLCDLVSFGVTPAFLLYNFSLHEDPYGFMICMFFVGGGAYRLARFNTQSLSGKCGGYSSGIPIPMPAALVAALIMTYEEIMSYDAEMVKSSHIVEFVVALCKDKEFIRKTLAFYMIVCTIGMVSTFKYFSNKMLKLPENKTGKIAVIGCIIMCALLLNYHFVFGSLFILTVYCIHGPIVWVFEKANVLIG